MPLPEFSDLNADPRFEALPQDKKIAATNDYWNQYQAENPNKSDYVDKQKANSLNYLDVKSKISDAAPVQKRILDAQLAGTKLNLALNEGLETKQINNDQARQALADFTASKGDDLNKASKTQSLLAPQTQQEMQPAFDALKQSAAKGGIFGSPTAVAHLDPNTYLDKAFTPSKESAGEQAKSEIQGKEDYDKLKAQFGNDFHLSNDEVDDVVKHQMGLQKEDVSRDVLGTVHLKDDLLFKSNDEINKSIDNSDLPQSEKDAQKAILPQRLDVFKQTTVDNIVKNHPKFAEQYDIKDASDFDRLKPVLLKDPTSQTAAGLVGSIAEAGSKLVAGAEKTGIFGPTNDDPDSADRETASTAISDFAERNKDFTDISHQFNKDKTSIFGQDAASIGRGIGSLGEAVGIGALTGGMGEFLLPAAEIEKAGAFGKAALTFAKGAVDATPVAGYFGANAALDTYKSAKSAGKTDDEAKGLAITSGAINTLGFMLFGGAGAGGVSKIGTELGTEAFRNTAVKTFMDAAKAIGKTTTEESLKMGVITALDTAAVQAKINPNMTMADFNKSVMDTMVTTGFLGLAASAPHEIGKYNETHNQSTPELQQRADALHPEENLPTITAPDASVVNPEPTAPPVDRGTLEAQRNALPPGTPEREAIEEKLADIPENSDRGIPISENASIPNEPQTPPVSATEETPPPDNEQSPSEVPDDAALATDVDSEAGKVDSSLNSETPQESQPESDPILNADEPNPNTEPTPTPSTNEGEGVASPEETNSLKPQLDQLSDKWKKQGVQLDLSEETGKNLGSTKGAITLDLVRVPDEQQKKGIGSKVLDDLKELSDKTGKPIELLPTDLTKDNSNSSLPEFYKKNGFEEYSRGKDLKNKERSPGYRYEPKATTTNETKNVSEKNSGKLQEGQSGGQEADVQKEEKVNTKSIPSTKPAVDEKLPQPTSKKVVEPTESVPLEKDQNPPSDSKKFTATNAAMDADLKKLKIDPVAKTASKALGKSWDEALTKVKENRNAGTELIQSLNKKPRPISDIEQGVLLEEYAQRQIRAAKAQIEVKEAAKSGDPATLAEAEDKYYQARSDIREAVIANKLAGSEWGKAGRFRQISIDEKFDIVSMKTRVETEINRGEKLSDAQSKLIEELQSRIEKSQEDGQIALVEQEAHLRNEFEKQFLERNTPKADPGKQQKANLDRQIKDAYKRIKSKLNQFGSGPDISMIGDFAIIGQAYLRKGIISLKAFANKLAEEFGEETRPYAEQAFERSKELLANSGLSKTPQQVLAEIDPNAILNRKVVHDMAKSYIREGLRGSAVFDKVHEDLKTIWPDVSRNRVADYITDHDRAVNPTRNELKEELGNVQKIVNISRRIADLESGKKSEVRKRSKKEVSDELANLQGQLKELVKNSKVNLTAEEIKENRVVQAAQKRTAIIRDKIAKGDFSKEVKPDPLKTKKIEEAQLEEIKAKEDYNRLFFEDALKKRSTVTKALQNTGEVVNLARSMMTSLDLPPILRQGALVTASHPLLALKELPKSIKSGFSEDSFKLNEKELQDNKYYDTAKTAGLQLTETGPNARLSKQEEAFRGHLAEKIPGIKQITGFSERNYNTFLNGIRISMFENLASNISRSGDLTPTEAKIIAKFVNNTTGRGNLGDLGKAGDALSTIFFSPRYLASRFNVIAGVVPAAFDVATGFKFRSADTVRARKVIAKEYARIMIGYALVYGAYKLTKSALGLSDDQLSVEIDPRSSNFGKIKIGNTYFDPTAGIAPNLTFIARLLSAQTKTSKGQVKSLTNATGTDQTYFGVVTQMVRGKLAPLPGAIVNIGQGSDITGNKTTLRSEVPGMFIPMSPNDIYDQFREFGPMGALGAAFFTLFGTSVQVHDQRLSLKQQIAVKLGEDPNDFSRAPKAKSVSGPYKPPRQYYPPKLR